MIRKENAQLSVFSLSPEDAHDFSFKKSYCFLKLSKYISSKLTNGGKNDRQ
jgi:hypothetical protein